MRTEEGQINGYSRSISDDSVSGRGIDSSMGTSSNLLSSPSRLNYIEHHVSKMDTLAGVAIKYGVEVADIKRLNGLVTDLQMFAHKSLQIPLPGRHPPSPILSNGSASPGESSNGHNKNRRLHVDLLDSLESLKLKSSPQCVSPAMSSLQNYYGLAPLNNSKGASEGMEMAVYKTRRDNNLEDESPSKTSPASGQPPVHRKTRSFINGHLQENVELAEDVQVGEAREAEAEKSNEKAVRRRQKTDAEDSGGFPGTMGKRASLRPKSMSRTAQAADAESGGLNPILLGDTLVADGFISVRKSSSTSNLQDSSENNSIWPTAKWNLKPDLQALSAAAITRPIFDGLPKPISGWRNKTALD